jgi:peroxiredoxin
MKKIILTIFSLAFFFSVHAQDGYKIEVELEDFEKDSLFLGFFYGNNQYLKDTAVVSGGDRKFVFQGEESLSPGVYMVVIPPENRYFQLHIDKEQRFSVTTKVQDPSKFMKVNGSKDNELLYEYLNYLAAQKPKAEELNKKIQEGDKSAQGKMDQLNEDVSAFQRKMIADNPQSITSAIIKANLPLDIPEFEGEEQDQQMKRWRWMQKNYFNQIDLTDQRLLRTPFLFERVDYFVNKLQVQHPDTIAMALDYVLEKMRPAEETFKFYLIHYLNQFAGSKIVGMDAVYVHIVEQYYAKGDASWTDEEQLKKIVDNANELKPLLIGKTAPDVRLEDKSGKAYNLHDIDSEYTILYFWRYDCGHCKKSTPFMKEFYEKFKDRGVKLVAVCVKFTKDVPDCWKYVDENEIGDWMHLVDPYHRSKFSKIYNVKTTPQLYILDKNKEIISKRIGAEQLEEVMDKIIEMNKQEKQEQSGDSK